MFERTAQGLTVTARLWGCVLLTGLLLGADRAHAIDLFRDYHPEVVVSDPYLELRTGPARGYPIFYVADLHIMRSSVWMIGFVCVVGLFVRAG